MSDDPYTPPESADEINSSRTSSLLRFAVYLIMPSAMISVSLLAGVIPLWQAPLFVGAGFLMFWGGELLGTWLFASGLSRSQKAIRWSLYSVPVTIWAVSKVYSAYGMLASLLIVLAIVPGFIVMLIWDKPPRDRGS
jgi:hypothetical protein